MYLRWVCTSGLSVDLATTDEIAQKVMEEIMEEECKLTINNNYKIEIIICMCKMLMILKDFYFWSRG